jgi:phage protein D
MPDGSLPIVSVTWTAAKTPIASAVRKVVVEDHDRLVDEARITLDDGAQLAEQHVDKGQQIDVALGWGDKPTQIFTGRIVRNGGQTGTAGGAPAGATLVAHDPTEAMHRETKGRTFPEKSKLSTIVETIRKDYADLKLGSIQCDPDPTFVAPGVPNQLDRTDFQFLQDLAAIWGCRCFAEINDGKLQFYFKTVKSLFAAKPMATLSHCRGWGNVLAFRYEKVASRSARQLVNTVTDPRTGTATLTEGAAPQVTPTPGGTVSPDVAKAEPEIARANDAAAQAAASSPPPPPGVLAQFGLPSDPATAASLVVSDPTQVIGYRAAVTVVGHPDLRAKGRVTLTGIAPWAEGDWWVRKAVHTWTQARDARGRPTASYETELELTR